MNLNFFQNIGMVCLSLKSLKSFVIKNMLLRQEFVVLYCGLNRFNSNLLPFGMFFGGVN